MQALRTYCRSRILPRLLKNRAFVCHLRSPSVIPASNLPRNFVSHKFSTATNVPSEELIDMVTFEKVCEETLESLTEYFEHLVEESDNLKSADISYSSGVLTANLGRQYGTYVINRQTPNRQIWLSSPISGPKRYDFVIRDNCWVYKHDGQSLHQLLQNEISKIVNVDVNFADCSYSKV